MSAAGTRLAELCRAAREGDTKMLLAQVPYARYLGVRMQVSAGTPRFSLPFTAHLVGNPALPAVHGGVVAAFMENAALLHLLLMLPAGRMPRSVDFSIDYLRSARTETLYAGCEVTRLGRRVAQVQIRCTQVAQGADEAADAGFSPAATPDGAAETGDDRLVALARAHFLLAEPE